MPESMGFGRQCIAVVLDCKPCQVNNSAPAGIARREATSRRDIFGSFGDLGIVLIFDRRMATELLMV